MAPVWLTMAPTLMGSPFLTVPAPLLSATTGAPAPPPPTTVVVVRPGVPADDPVAAGVGTPLGSGPAPPLTYTVLVVAVVGEGGARRRPKPATTRGRSRAAERPPRQA